MCKDFLLLTIILSQLIHSLDSNTTLFHGGNILLHRLLMPAQSFLSTIKWIKFFVTQFPYQHIQSECIFPCIILSRTSMTSCRPICKLVCKTKFHSIHFGSTLQTSIFVAAVLPYIYVNRMIHQLPSTYTGHSRKLIQFCCNL